MNDIGTEEEFVEEPEKEEEREEEGKEEEGDSQRGALRGETLLSQLPTEKGYHSVTSQS